MEGTIVISQTQAWFILSANAKQILMSQGCFLDFIAFNNVVLTTHMIELTTFIGLNSLWGLVKALYKVQFLICYKLQASVG